MPRDRIRLAAPPGPPPVPDWWADEFHKRQNQLKTLILRLLGRVGRAMTCTEIASHTTGYWANEHRHARQSLIDEGLLTRFEAREKRLCGPNGGHVIQTYTYYELTKR